MGQVEVYELLLRRYDSGDRSYHSMKEVRHLLKSEGLEYGNATVRACLLRLEGWGFIESKMTGTLTNWNRRFRVKKTERRETPLTNISGERKKNKPRKE